MNTLFVGYGRMGSAIGEAWLAKGLVERVLAVDPHAGDVTAERFNQLDELPAIDIDLVVIAVKPGHVAQVAAALPATLVRNALIVSVAAGITLSSLRAAAPANATCVRVMPNTPVLAGAGCTALYSDNASVDQRASLTKLFGSVGNAYWVEREPDLNTVTAISGSGPAYFHLFCEAMTEAAVALGLSETLARNLVIDTAWGAARLQQQPGARFETLREAVTSPNGTTAAAITAFEHDNGLRDLVTAAVQAAWRRSEELSASC